MRQTMNVLVISMLCSLLQAACGSSSTSQDPANAETSGGDVKAAADPAPAPADPAVSTAAAPNTCQTDSDCVKDKCCHAAACVPTTGAPDCSEAMCTTECKDGTMDCGKGSCACIDNACAVKWAP